MKSIYLKYEIEWITRVHNTIKMWSSYLCIWSSPRLFLFLRLNIKHSISLTALVLQILYINMHTSIIYTYPCLLSYWLNFSLLAFTLEIYLVSFRHSLANFFFSFRSLSMHIKDFSSNFSFPYVLISLFCSLRVYDAWRL